MAYPVIYGVGYSYTAFQQSQGNSSFPGTQLDADLAGLSASMAGLSTFTQNVIRSDGALQNGIVTYDSLSTSLQTGGFEPADPWVATTAYVVNDSVIANSKLYRGLIAHTSGVFATDLAAGKWLFIADLLPGVQGPQGVPGAGFTFVNPAGADGGNIFGGTNVGNSTLSPGGGAATLASANYAFGKDTLNSLTTGYGNFGGGLAVMGLATTAFFNVGVGNNALGSLIGGSGNVAVGQSAAYRTAGGVHNTAIGLQAFYENTSGSHNSYGGRDSGFSNTTGNWNSGWGTDANAANETGSGNSAFGGESGYTENLANANRSGSNNTYMGYQSGPSSPTQYSNSIAVGYRAKISASFQAVFGGTDITETILRGNVKPPSLWLSGTAGAGFVELPTQTVAATPGAAGTLRLYADPSERFSIRNASGFAAGFSLASLTVSRNYTLPDAAGIIALTAGANIPAVAAGDILYGSAANALSALADVATGNALVSGGVGVAPAWGKIALTTHVSGTLPAANGGTGVTSLGAGVATWLGTPSSANLAAALTDESGSGLVPFETTGTWTPSDQSGAGLVFSAVNCRYTRIGNIVHAYGTLTFPATANAAVALIGGLPFTVPNTTYATVASPVKNTVGITGLLVVPVANSTTFNFWNNGTAENNTNTAMQNSVCSFNISYPVA